MLGSLLEAGVAGALRHLLEQHQWARQLLAQHAGQTFVIGLQVQQAGLEGLAPDLAFRITPEGLVEKIALDESRTPHVKLLLRPSVKALLDASEAGPPGLQRHLHVQGDVMLAASLAQLAQHLRWDMEADLSKIMGEAIAHRTGKGLRAAPGVVQAQVSRVGEEVSEWLTTESQTLVAQAQLHHHAAALRDLVQRIEALEGRLSTLKTA
jgi:ubiquinone biosynthesis protein UbiJ